MRLQVDAVSHTYADGTAALRGVTFDAGPGITGLLGPNGAGKSTLLRTIATLQRPTAGTVRVGDVDAAADPRAVRAVLGYLPQEFGLYPRLDAETTLDHFALLKGARDRAARARLVHALLARTNLWEHRRRAVGTFSGGMRQRLGLAIALAGAPRLLVLDEPTAGLDPAERARVYEILAEAAAGAVVLLSTHLVADVHALCDRVLVVDRGRIVLDGAPAALVQALAGRVWRRPADGWPGAPGVRVLSRAREGGRPVLRLLADAPPDAASTPDAPTLDDAYFAVVVDPAAGL